MLGRPVVGCIQSGPLWLLQSDFSDLVHTECCVIEHELRNNLDFT